jgi:hypothetical protein
MAEQIKMSDIRAKFPMYADMSDENLLLGLRKKFYADIPLKQFVNRIEFDTTADPAEGMSGTDKFLAGAGKAFTDLARGAGQMVGMVDREDVAASRKRDAPLMRTGAGMAGNVTGNIAALLPSALIPGASTIPGAALIGGATGLLAPSVSTQETLTNTALGGVLGPASVLAGRAVGATARAGKALFEPFTKSGQEKVAARTLQQFASDPTRAAANLRSARELVPGSRPTMAQAADDPGLAQLERTLQNNPETGGMLAEQYASQRAARLGAVKDVAGTDDYYNAIKEGRDIFAREDYAKAMSSGIDAKMADALSPQLESLMRRPAIKQAAAMAKRLAANSDEELTDFGTVRGLDWLKKGLDAQIDRAVNPANALGKSELRALLDTKRDLMSVIEDIAPAYKEANENFAKMSGQINSMDVARGLQQKFEPALARYGANTREHAGAYASALESAKESVKRQTGLNKNIDQVMPRDDVRMLENVARDLGRKAKADDMGRAVGSNTAQNLAAQNLLRRSLGPTGLPQSWAESNLLQGLLSPYTGVAKLAGAERAVMERLVQAGMDPQEAARLLLLAQQPSGAAQLGMSAQRYLPTAPLGGLLAYPAQQ